MNDEPQSLSNVQSVDGAKHMDTHHRRWLQSITLCSGACIGKQSLREENTVFTLAVAAFVFKTRFKRCACETDCLVSARRNSRKAGAQPSLSHFCARVRPAAANCFKRSKRKRQSEQPLPRGDLGVVLFINANQERLPLEELHVEHAVTMFQMSSQYPVGNPSGPTTG